MYVKRYGGDVCILRTLLPSLCSLTVRRKQLLNNGYNPLTSTKTLSTLLFKSLFPSLSGHIPLLLNIKCRNRAQHFITGATPEMINNRVWWQFIMSVLGRRNSQYNKMSNNNMATAQLVSRCCHTDLGAPLLPRCHGNTDAMGSFLKLTGADKSWRCVNKALGEK